MDHTALSKAVGEHELHGGDEAGRAVGNDQQRRPQAPGHHAVEEAPPGVGGLRGARLQAHQHGATLGGHAPCRQHRLGPGAVVVAEVGAVQVEVLQGDVGQVALLPDVELGLDGLTHPAHRRLRQRGLGAEGVGQGRLDVADGQAADEAGDDQGLQGVGPAHPHPQQPGGEGLVRAPQLRALDGDGPGCGLDRGRAVAVAAARAGTLAVGVALPAEELGELGLQGGLEEQAHADTGHLLQDLAEVAVRGEQVVDVGADALEGGYSCGHGCGFLSLLARLREEPTPVVYLHRGLDATPPTLHGIVNIADTLRS